MSHITLSRIGHSLSTVARRALPYAIHTYTRCLRLRWTCRHNTITRHTPCIKYGWYGDAIIHSTDIIITEPKRTVSPAARVQGASNLLSKHEKICWSVQIPSAKAHYNHRQVGIWKIPHGRSFRKFSVGRWYWRCCGCVTGRARDRVAPCGFNERLTFGNRRHILGRLYV